MARVVGGGVEVEGLRETVNGLRRVDATFGKEANAIFREAAIDVKTKARGRSPGGSMMGVSSRVFGHSGTARGAAVKLRASVDPRAYAAEYGENVAHVFGRPFPQSAMSSRTAKPHKPPTSTEMRHNRGGYMIQPVLRMRLPYWDHEVAKRLTLLIQKAVARG